jgi:hypothetical protein
MIDLRPPAAALFAAAMLLTVLTGQAQAAKDDVVLVSRANGAAGRAADDGTIGGASSMSANGRFVAFPSQADNLSGEDDNSFINVFVRDLLAGTTTLVNRATGAGGAAAHDESDSTFSSLSANGRFVVFVSRADNLSADDNDGTIDSFVRDLQADTTTFVTRATGAAGLAANGSSIARSISADGHFVAFDSNADNLSTEDSDLTEDVFVRDLEANTTILVSRETGVAGAAAYGNHGALSADGRFVAFQSGADNLSADDADGTQDVFVRDLQANTTTLVSRATGAAGVAADAEANVSAVSADGRFVLFYSIADNLSAEDTDGTVDSFVRDLQTNTTTLVTRASGAAGAAADSGGFASSISADGRFVAFYSIANNLSAQDNDTVPNAYVRDLRTNTTTYVSRAAGAAGAPADDTSFPGALSADGRFVAFASLADNLSAEDRDGTLDIFVRDVSGAPGGGGGGPGPSDTQGPALSARSLTRGNGAIRVSRSGRFTLFCGRYAEPVTGTCGGRALKRAPRIPAKSFSAPARRRVLVRVRLSRTSLGALERAKRVRMRGTVVARDRAGNRTTVRFRFTLKAPKRR